MLDSGWSSAPFFAFLRTHKTVTKMTAMTRTRARIPHTIPTVIPVESLEPSAFVVASGRCVEDPFECGCVPVSSTVAVGRPSPASVVEGAGVVESPVAVVGRPSPASVVEGAGVVVYGRVRKV